MSLGVSAANTLPNFQKTLTTKISEVNIFLSNTLSNNSLISVADLEGYTISSVNRIKIGECP